MQNRSGRHLPPESEITPAMREAGASVIERLSGVVDTEYLAGEVYRTMAQLKAPESLVDQE